MMGQVGSKYLSYFYIVQFIYRRVGSKYFELYTVQFINIISYLSEKYLLKVGLMANNKIDTGVDKIGLAEGEVEQHFDLI